MQRRSVLALSGAALAGLAGCTGDDSGADPTTDDPTTDDPGGTTNDPTDGTTDPGSTDPPTTLQNPSFEDDWTGWAVDTYLPDDPNYEQDRAVAYKAGVNTFQASDGIASLELAIDGSQDDGTVWVQQPVDLSEYQSVSVDYLVSNSFNEIRNAAVYAGPVPDDPLEETDFDTSQSLEGHDQNGWKTFSYPVEHDGPGVVAVGFSIVWETTANAVLDNVVLSESPPPTTTTTPPTTGDPDNSSIEEGE